MYKSNYLKHNQYQTFAAMVYYKIPYSYPKVSDDRKTCITFERFFQKRLNDKYRHYRLRLLGA
jgi:hypothetical protein